MPPSIRPLPSHKSQSGHLTGAGSEDEEEEVDDSGRLLLLLLLLLARGWVTEDTRRVVNRVVPEKA